MLHHQCANASAARTRRAKVPPCCRASAPGDPCSTSRPALSTKSWSQSMIVSMRCAMTSKVLLCRNNRSTGTLSSCVARQQRFWFATHASRRDQLAAQWLGNARSRELLHNRKRSTCQAVGRTCFRRAHCPVLHSGVQPGLRRQSSGQHWRWPHPAPAHAPAAAAPCMPSAAS